MPTLIEVIVNFASPLTAGNTVIVAAGGYPSVISTLTSPVFVTDSVLLSPFVPVNTYTQINWADALSGQVTAIGFFIANITGGASFLKFQATAVNGNPLFTGDFAITCAALEYSGMGTPSTNATLQQISVGSGTLHAVVADSNSVSVDTIFGTVSQTSCNVLDVSPVAGTDYFFAARITDNPIGSPLAPTVTPGGYGAYSLRELPGVSGVHFMSLWLMSSVTTITIPKLITKITFVGSVGLREVQPAQGTTGTTNTLTTSSAVTPSDLALYFATELDTAVPALTVNRGTNLQAIAFDNAASLVKTEVPAGGAFSAVFTRTNTANDGWGESIIVVQSLAPTTAVNPPSFSPPSGTILPDNLQSITITAAAGLTIYYTTDGTLPTTGSLIYSSPIPVPTDIQIRAIAVSGTGVSSSVASATYTIATAPGPGPAPGPGGTAGAARIFWKTAPSSDSYMFDPANNAFRQTHIYRTMVYAGGADNQISVGPMWFYRDSSSLYHPADDGLVAANPTWVYRSSGQPCFINFGPIGTDGLFAQYLPDHGDTGFRSWWISQAQIQFAKGYTGVWIDDVNLDINAVVQGGAQVRPTDVRTGAPVTDANYQKYLAEFLEAVRAAFPGKEIGHNALYWNGGGNPSTNTLLTRQIQASNFFNIERGFDDSGIQGGTGTFGLRTIFGFIDQVHGLGRNFIAEQTPGVSAADYFPLACYFLVNDGSDMFQATEGGFPPGWPAIDYVDLGSATTARYDWNGLIRRDFATGSVFVAEPGGSGGSALGTTMADPSGNLVSSVFLGSRQGMILSIRNAFTQRTAGMTVLRSYTFGTDTGRNIQNLTDLSAHFDPFGIAGTTVINQEWERYQAFNTQNHNIAAGSLKITATIPSGGGLFNGGINSGQIWTQETFQPGVTGKVVYAIEANIKIPSGLGMWPAFWCYTKSPVPGVADSSEIDMFEFFEGLPGNDSTTMSSNLHGPGVGATTFNLFNGFDLYVPGFDFAAAFHLYQWVWTTTAVEKYVDGILVRATNFAWTSNGPGQIGMNLACGTDAPGLPGVQPTSLGEFPAAVEVEHLTIWAA